MTGRIVAVVRSGNMPEELDGHIRKCGFISHIEAVLTVNVRADARVDVAPGEIIVLTSANAVPAIASRGVPRNAPVLCVGPQTAEAARGAGFENVTDNGGDAAALARTLRARTGERFVYFRGAEIAFDLRRDVGGAVREEIVYETRVADALSAPLLSALAARRVAAIMVFSPRGADAFVRLATEAGVDETLAETKALSIGKGVLQSLSVLPFSEILVAETPDRHGMMRLLDGLSDSVRS